MLAHTMRAWHGAAPVVLGLCALAWAERAPAQEANAWGWPEPYEQVSERSKAWLKEKGWWPITVAYQPPWSGQNTVNIVMDRLGLMGKRGIAAKWQGFPSGPAINEVMVAARAQVASGGNFPFTSLLDKKVPVKAIAILSPNLLHATVVPNDSPIRSLQDFKGAPEPATIGIVTGSSSEFYFQMAAQVNGLEIGRDVILKNMPPGEQMAMPKGIAAVVPWDPTPAMMVEERKNGRIIDAIFPYNMYEGNFYVRQELIDNVPDVVQLLSDAHLEATLYIRLNPQQAVDWMAEDAMLRNYSKAILLQQIAAYSNLLKPTFVYPLAKFWGDANAPIFDWLYRQNRIQTPLKSEDFQAAVEARFMQASFHKLGWTIPAKPPFIPANWTGKLDVLPYPDYVHAGNTQTPQPFPEPGDLTRPWRFAGKTYAP
jgi:sulfonate transport system substrate-binding protein